MQRQVAADVAKNFEVRSVDKSGLCPVVQCSAILHLVEAVHIDKHVVPAVSPFEIITF